MTTLRLALFALAAAFLAGAGCGTLDVASDTNPDRVLSGRVRAGVALPAGAEVVVRLLAPPTNSEAPRPAINDMPVVTRPAAQNLERVLGEQTQTLTAGTIDPVPFLVAYHAEDALLRRGLTVDVRVSIGGRVRFRTINTHGITLASSAYPQEVMVQSVER